MKVDPPSENIDGTRAQEGEWLARYLSIIAIILELTVCPVEVIRSHRMRRSRS